MSTAVPSPSPASPPPPSRPSGPAGRAASHTPATAHALDEPKADRRVGLIGTVAVHVVLLAVFLLLPDDLLDNAPAPAAGDTNRTFEIELSQDVPRPVEPAQAPEPPPLRFVEVNPDAPENTPDDTNLFGKQNQQVAQPVPTPDGETDTPSLSGEGKPDTTALVSGLTTEAPQPAASEALAQAFTPPTPPTPDPERERDRRTEEREAEARAVNPLPGGENILGTSDGGLGSTVATAPPVRQAETDVAPVKGSADGGASGAGYFSGTPAIDRARPQDRPRLTTATVNARRTPTIKNEFGSKNIGAIAYDAKWSAYGEYLQRLIDAVQGQWERLILRSSFYPTSGSLVRVVFKLDTTGRISEIVRVDGTGAELAQRLCVSSITERAPYGEWSEDMIAVLGKEQELTFTFYYQ